MEACGSGMEGGMQEAVTPGMMQASLKAAAQKFVEEVAKIASAGGSGGWFRRTHSVDIRAGDTIVVPLDTERVPALPVWQSVTTIIYNLAVALLAINSVK